MKFQSLKNLIGPVLGGLFFFLMFDARILDPSNFQWLLGNDDLANSFIGWRFFQHEAWRFPPGAATDYGMDMGSSIVFTDSIPLFALLFKPFRALLPDSFQYMGLWLLTCYVCQGGIGWLVAGRITRSIPIRSIIVAFFVVSPILLNRAVSHYALMGHWLILAAIYLYTVELRARVQIYWGLLVCASALVHGYLLYVVCAIWCADMARRLFVDRAISLWHWFRSALATVGALGISMWLAGYFTLPTRDLSGGAENFGRYAANLNSFWNPVWFSTLFASPLPVRSDNAVESASYLGFGMLLMLPISVLVIGWRWDEARTVIRVYVPLGAVAVLLWIIALSNQIAFGDQILFTIPLSEATLNLMGTLRASGRLLWVAYYGILLAVPAILIRCLRPALAGTILGVGLLLQLADFAPRYIDLRADFHRLFVVEAASRTPQLKSPFWQRAANHYRYLLFAPIVHIPDDFDAFALYAANYGMRINAGYFARVSADSVRTSNEAILQDLARGELRSDGLYIVQTPVDYRLESTDGQGTIDGYSVIAPNWFTFEDCCIDPEYLLAPGNPRD